MNTIKVTKKYGKIGLCVVLMSFACYLSAMRPVDKALFKAVRENNMASVEKLLGEGADVNARNEIGYTPLSDVKSPEVAQVLLNNGALTEVKGGMADDTPLGIMCSDFVSREKGIGREDVTFDALQGIINLLIMKGANVNATYYGFAGERAIVENLLAILIQRRDSYERNYPEALQRLKLLVTQLMDAGANMPSAKIMEAMRGAPRGSALAEIREDLWRRGWEAGEAGAKPALEKALPIQDASNLVEEYAGFYTEDEISERERRQLLEEARKREVRQALEEALPVPGVSKVAEEYVGVDK